MRKQGLEAKTHTEKMLLGLTINCPLCYAFKGELCDDIMTNKKGVHSTRLQWAKIKEEAEKRTKVRKWTQ